MKECSGIFLLALNTTQYSAYSAAPKAKRQGIPSDVDAALKDSHLPIPFC